MEVPVTQKRVGIGVLGLLNLLCFNWYSTDASIGDSGYGYTFKVKKRSIAHFLAKVYTQTKVVFSLLV